jgi:hypothetical protein
MLKALNPTEGPEMMTIIVDLQISNVTQNF